MNFTPLMPDGRPCPAIMTPAEVCEFFRIEKKSHIQVKRAIRSLQDNGLKCFRVSWKAPRFRLEEVLRFAEIHQEKSLQ